MIMSRTWQMPNSNTFQIKPINEIIELNNKLSVTVSYEDEKDVLKQIYTKIGENIMYWWD